MDYFLFFFKRKKENHFNKVESQHKEEQQRIQVLHLLEVIKLHQESIKQINTVKKKMWMDIWRWKQYSVCDSYFRRSKIH